MQGAGDGRLGSLDVAITREKEVPLGSGSLTPGRELRAKPIRVPRAEPCTLSDAIITELGRQERQRRIDELANLLR
jgi:hypothetical protein